MCLLRKRFIRSLSDFLAADIDHLLPKSNYPEFDSDPDNWVLSCRACNSMKGKAKFLKLKWEPQDALKNHKKELIEIIKNGLAEKRRSKEMELDEIRSVIQGE